jgi:hypothetical protein
VEEESAPKKQFGLKKKTFFIFLGLFIVLAFVVAGVTYFLLKERKERLEVEGEYVKLLEYCGEGDGEVVECKVLLKDFYDSEDGERDCMEIVLPIADSEKRDISLCLKKGVVEWENPYGDYEKYVPVSIKMSVGKSLLGFSKLENAKFFLMEDQELFDILETLPEDQGRGSYFQSLIYIKEQQEIFDKGYYITSPIGSDTRNRLVLYDAEVKEISSREGKVVLLFSTRIYEKELSFLVSTEEFEFARLDESEGEILIGVEEVGLFEKEGHFFLIFDFTLEEVEVEEYLKSLLESEEEEIILNEEFNLIGVVAKEI